MTPRIEAHTPPCWTPIEKTPLRYQPYDLGIGRKNLTASLLNLQRYVAGRHDLWYTVINQRTIEADWVEAALAGLEFCQ